MPPGPVRVPPPASVSVFDLGAGARLLEGLRLVGQARGAALVPAGPESEKETSLREQVHKGQTEVSERMFCSACVQSFQSRQDQREHYRLDWHRFNLKQRLKGQPSLSVHEFEKQSCSGDLSSISGSDDSDSNLDSDTENVESEDLDTVNEEGAELGRPDPLQGFHPHRVLFQNAQGQFLSAFRCLLGPRQDPPEEAELLLQALQGGGPRCCVVLMAAAGHFAGAIFRGRDVVTHKTFHRYTVRARRGTAQGLQDARAGGSRSAGANLRRYNEAALFKEVRELLAGPGWAGPLGEAGTILLRAPRSGRALFFGGRGAPLQRGDPRLWHIPLATRRPTFRELQRVLQALAMVHIHGEDPRETARLDSPQTDWKVTSQKKTSIQEKGPGDDEVVLGLSGSEGECSSPVELELVELTLGTLDLREFELLPKRRRRKRKKSQEVGAGVDMALQSPQETVSLPQIVQENMVPLQPSLEEVGITGQQELWDTLWTACRAGDLGTLKHQLEALPSDTRIYSLLSAPLGSGGWTLLHAAAAAGRSLVVQLLLESGADPTIRDSCARPPYTVAADKMTRNEFRKFMGKNPDAHDYSKAQVPGPLTAEMEAQGAARRREQKAVRRLREEQRRKQQEHEKQEQEEQQRFAALSDREKRALAAERRLAAQMETLTPQTPRRCWVCGASLLGLVPFHYLDFSFCSTRCLQEHRRGRRPLS
ncbi:ankyrin repeat and zinc finger domain-containing protein 1 isoform X2 [Gracilinanus agilis]|uniref:ankyrin repeat and zinc finger domain-containing protein 1 isoform X2 n=1 Tax=Gracilinanus agilis TaxID=191870 RepID=UPI001CFCE898|nr:ankyrin repeat and zinc finger domain-containing protein 1 isoform X2 [Gracilinanus agilis]